MIVVFGAVGDQALAREPHGAPAAELERELDLMIGSPTPKTARPRLSVTKIRQLFTESKRHDIPVLGWRTRNLDVVANQVIRPMAATNIGMRMPQHEVQTISLWRISPGFTGFPGYGDYILLVRSVDLLSAYPRQGAAGEWQTPHDIPIEVGGWATIADVNTALGL